MKAGSQFMTRAAKQVGALMLAVLCGLGGCASQGIAEQDTQPSTLESNPAAPPSPVPTSGPKSDPRPVAGAAASPAAPPVISKYPLERARLTLHVGKTGKLARLGHNHLITAALNGTAWLNNKGDLQATAVLAVAEMVVDDPERRGQQVTAGNDAYTSVPSDKNIRDTRANMLGERVLDAAAYPEIRATAYAPDAAAEFSSASAGSLNTDFTLTVRGSKTTERATLHWRREGSEILWNSTFTVSHQQLGMTPFSALGGALRVADDLKIDLQGTLTGPFSLGSD